MGTIFLKDTDYFGILAGSDGFVNNDTLYQERNGGRIQRDGNDDF